MKKLWLTRCERIDSKKWRIEWSGEDAQAWHVAYDLIVEMHPMKWSYEKKTDCFILAHCALLSLLPIFTNACEWLIPCDDEPRHLRGQLRIDSGNP